MQRKDEILRSIDEAIAGYGSDIFIVQIDYNKNAKRIQVYADTDSGISLDECSKLNKHIRHTLNEKELGDDHVLEVSSPGLDRPLLNTRQYSKHLGQQINLTLRDSTVHTGRLETVREKGIELNSVKAKNKTQDTTMYTFDQIEKANIVITF